MSDNEITKPEGFDLRDHRSDKNNDGALWLPSDALYEASIASAKDKTDSVLIIWREKSKDGGHFTHWRFAGPEDSLSWLLLHAMKELK